MTDAPKSMSADLTLGKEMIFLQSMYTGLTFPDVRTYGSFGLKFIAPISKSILALKLAIIFLSGKLLKDILSPEMQ